ncbi:DUF1345 domain-containing protein [Novosphingobium tardum]|uniref:DUF1345 domain-containing protein n=1 Tax=Novosphingobium tardum TaxID=1538021 RepID=A0ABV8RJV6_9SPHN
MTTRRQTAARRRTPARANAADRKAPGWGNKIAPPKFLLFAAVLVAATPLFYRWPAQGWLEAFALAFDAGALVFLASISPLFRDCGAEVMREHSAANDANRAIVLAFTTIVTIAVLGAISGELKGAQSHDWWAVAKLIGTLAISWLFTNVVFTLHYAHSYYSQLPRNGGDEGGLDFGGTNEPDYWDFLYFACTLGMTFQTSDVAISTGHLRRVVLLHSIAAFVFNIGVIAFTINALGGGK